MSGNTQAYIYKWINPNTNKEEILGNLIEYKSLNQCGHGGRFQFTFDTTNINESINEQTFGKVCDVSYNDKNQLIIKGYIGMGMNYQTGMFTIKKF